MKSLLKIFFISFLSLSYVVAEETGSASVILFLNGMSLQNNEVLVDGVDKFYTDEDGSISIILTAGKHLIEVFAKDEHNDNIGYAKKTIMIKDSRDTQVIITYNNDNAVPYIEVDTPIGDSENAQSNTTAFGTLRGLVLASDKNTPIGNARVFVKGTSIDAKTDQNGIFEIKVPSERNISISVVHAQYSAQTRNNLFVIHNGKLDITLKLTPASMELEEFIVLAPKVKGSIVAIMAEEKASNAVVNILGNEEIAKKGDSDAAGALKRITGVTIVDGKDVYVRGLGGRYSNVEMNSMPLPSPDPQRRTVPLDIFPAAVIGSLKVQKSATADIPASFGGGYVDVRTKEVSKENYFKITTEIKANANTGKVVNNYVGSSTDWIGSDNGYRTIPADILDASAITVGQKVPQFDPANNAIYTAAITSRSLTTTKEALPYGGKIAIEGAYNFELTDKHTLSVFANYTYKQDHLYREEEYYSYAFSRASNALYTKPEQYGVTQKTTQTYTNAAIFNLSYNYAHLLDLKFTKLYSKISEKVTRVTEGIANSDNDYKIRYNLNWEERTLDMNQLSGNTKYKIADYINQFHFGMELGRASLNQPNNYKYAYRVDTGPDQTPLGDPYLDRYSANVFLNMTSDDDMSAFYLKNKTEFSLFNNAEYIEVGYSSSSKTRQSRYNKYSMQKLSSDKYYDDIDTIYANNLDDFRLDISFLPAYWYDAKIDEASLFANFFFKPLNNLEILFGLRDTDYKQTVYEYSYGDSIANPISKVPQSLKFTDILPSLSIKYLFDKSNQLSLAASKTYIVPDLREFTSAQYFHPYEVATVEGNPNLLNTDISNLDIKYSHYFSTSESLSFGVFYKYLDNPIEDVMLPSSSLPRYGYDNADNATLYGIEIDGRKNLNFIDKSFKNFYFSGNFSYTKSNVSLTQEQQTLYTSNNRELQGLSPTVINLSFGYEKKDRSITLSYNKMGARIRKVGMVYGGDPYPDYYEVPPQIVDFVWIEKLNHTMALKVKLQNLLDEETIWYQGSPSNVTKRFKKGQLYSFAFSYKY